MTKERRLRALQNQIDRLRRRLKILRRRSNRYSWVRLAIFFGGLLISGLAYFFVAAWLFWLCLLGFGLLFGIAVYYNRQIERSIRRHETWLQLKTEQIARARLDWANLPLLWQPQPRPEHPFETDLDLVGQRSLHHLIDTAVSYEGSQLLRDWLTATSPEPREISRRQHIVRELIPLSLFRDKLVLNATAAAGARRMWDADRLTNWLKRHTALTSLRNWLLLFTALAGLNLVLLALNLLGLIRPIWQMSFVLYLGLLVIMTNRIIGGVFREAMALQETVRQLGAVFQQLESFSYRNTPHLKTLCAPFLDQNRRPARYLQRIGRIVTAMGLRENPFIWLMLNGLMPWDFYFAYRLHLCKSDMAQAAPHWLAAWFKLEALSSLANLAYLNPDYTLPTIVTDNAADQTPVFQTQAIGHPLIPDSEKVCNDFAISRLGQIVIITGSNMSGKSTFLRTIGINLALAYAGGPVDAQALRSRPYRLFTSIKVSDSVTNGISYFYAEVKRLRALLHGLEAEESYPLFFFIDEIFRGTNNRERFIGSQAYLRTLVGRNGVGFVATHDLELARLADQTPQIENYHFRDDISDGRMVFNYTLQPGPCPTTNALRIMAMEGLPVPDTNVNRPDP